MESFEIIDEITSQTVAAALVALDEAVDGNDITIKLPYNGGGSVDAAIDLIEAIKDTKASVTIEIDRYVISAAAFIYLWFVVYPEAHVEAKTTGAPAILVYHRPRVIVDEHLAFLNDLNDQMEEWESLKEFTDIFDKLFEYLIAACGYTAANENMYQYNQCELKHQLRHVRDGYYSNQDFVIPA
ncbi:Clp protease/crotonase-like domain-containing protein [Aeromonas caviae]|uniref:hypothetical protein n=1 Tax=Aeromonas caviae TaxID=648 RepID=UPI002B4A323E|nr:hypothetical protein [Aeromonas caviae]